MNERLVKASQKFIFDKMEAMYSESNYCERCGGFHDMVAVDLSGWEKVITQLAKDMHEGKIKPSDLDQGVIQKTFQELDKSAADGYGKGWQNESVKQPPSRDALLLQRNLYRFSGAKTFTMMQELNGKLVENGKIVPFDKFKSEALKLNDKYNLNHLQAEYQTASHSAKMAAQWENYVRNKERFPNLKYKTQEDDRVRDEHQVLNNKVAPIGGDFWKKFYPPNGFRCRCYVVQTAAAPSTDLPVKVDKMTPDFEMNVAQTREVFNETGKKPHPYFQMTKRDKPAMQVVEDGYDKMYAESIKRWAKAHLLNRTVKHPKIGVVGFTSNGIKEALNQPHKNKVDKNFDLYEIDSLIESAEVEKFDQPDKNGRLFTWHYLKYRNGYIVLRTDKLSNKTVFYSIVEAIK